MLPQATLSSALPAWWVEDLDLSFLLLFAPEFVLRASVYARSFRSGRAGAWEPVLLVADLLALVSFLPVGWMFQEAGYFRLFRLTRMLLLLGYWGDMVVDLWRILTGKERRAPVVFLLLLGLVLSFAGAVVLTEFAPLHDYDEDGGVDREDARFRHVLWWSFRQVQDPGNLAVQPAGLVLVSVSLGLTFAGLLLFTFLIGLSTGAMDELLRRARNRPVGLRGHTVILGLGPYSFYLLEELAEIYRKNARVLRVAVLGPGEGAPAYFHQKRLASFRYRGGDPARVADLDRVDVAAARRVLVTGPGGDSPDAGVISAILATRTRTRSAALFPDLDHERNLLAAGSAGGPGTFTIGSGPFLGYYVAQNVIYPGVYRAYRQLLTTAGCEIYTYLFDPAERRAVEARSALDPALMFAAASLRHRVTLVGCFVEPGDGTQSETVLLNPMDAAVRARHSGVFDASGRLRAAAVRGVVGICARWQDLRAAAREVVRGGALGEPARNAPGFEDLRLELPAGRAGKVLICGSSPRVPRVICELVLFFGTIDVTVLVRDTANVAPLEDDIQAAFEGHLAGVPRRGSHWLLDESEGCRVMRVTGEDGEATVRVLHGDWSEAGRILRHPAADLSGADAVLFLPRDPGDVSDGLVALDCLRLSQFGATGLVHFRPGLRVLGLFRDPAKSDLLESRLDEMAGPGAEARFTVVSSERIRHHFLVQHLFVRGLGSVFREIVGASGQHICRLVPRGPGGGPPAGDFDPWALAGHLLAGRSLVPLGLERAGASGRPEVALDPGELAPGRRIAWSSVRAIYVLGNGRALARADAADAPG